MTLQEHLTQEGIRAVEFARRAELSEAYVSQLLNGKRMPSLGVAQKIAELTGGAVTAADWTVPAKMTGEAA